MKIITELQKVWDAAPKEIQEHPEYAFQCGDDWEEIPETFKGKRVEVYNSNFIGKNRIHYAPKSMITQEEIDAIMSAEPEVKCVDFRDRPDLKVKGVTFDKKPNQEL